MSGNGRILARTLTRPALVLLCLALVVFLVLVILPAAAILFLAALACLFSTARGAPGIFLQASRPAGTCIAVRGPPLK